MSSTSRRRGAAILAAALGASALAAGTAGAATPSMARCPVTTPNLIACATVQTTDGSIAANGNTLPLGSSITVEGGFTQDETGINFVPPTSGPALTGKPVTVPGGLFGRNLPYNLNTVKATVEQVGPVDVNFNSSDLTLPIRIHFTNALLGNHCYLGSAASPIALHLTTGTTNPPAPNQPVTGDPGGVVDNPDYALVIGGVRQVDNAFSVPAVTGCGIVAQAQVTAAINRNLGLPSAAGHNSATLSDDIYFTAPPAS